MRRFELPASCSDCERPRWACCPFLSARKLPGSCATGSRAVNAVNIVDRLERCCSCRAGDCQTLGMAVTNAVLLPCSETGIGSVIRTWRAVVRIDDTPER